MNGTRNRGRPLTPSLSPSSSTSNSPERPIRFTRNFTKTLKKQIAKAQMNGAIDFTKAELSRLGALASKGSQGTGDPLLDLSHKLSLHSSEIMTNKIVRNAKYNAMVTKRFKEVLDLEPDKTTRANNIATKALTAMRKYEDANTSISPDSRNALSKGMHYITNQMPSNLRYRPSKENRTVSDYAHPNIEKRDLTPKSKKIFAFVQEVHRQYKTDWNSRENKNLRTYGYEPFLKKINATSQTTMVRTLNASSSPSPTNRKTK